MPLALRVETQLDERSLSDVRNQARGMLDGVGRDAGREFSQGITSQLDNIGPSFLRVGTAAEGAMAGISTGAAAAAVGVAAIGLAAVKVGSELYSLGSRFDAVADSMTIQTGKIGAELDALTESVSNVARNTAASFEQIGQIAQQLDVAFGASGQPLEELTKQIADLNRMTGETVDIRQFGQTLRGFGDDAGEATRALDDIFAASQQTLIPVGELIGTLQNVGPSARTLGLDMSETAGLITSFEQAGLDSSRMLTGLTTASREFSDAGIPLQTGLADTITQIRGFIDAGNDAAAVDLAGKVFGERSGQLFVDAIRQGTLSVESLNDGMKTSEDTISRMDQATSDFAETWDKVKNRALEALEPIGTKIFELLNSMGQLILGPEEPGPPLPTAPGQPFAGSGLLSDEPAPIGPLAPGQAYVPGGSALPPALGGVPQLIDPRITAPVPTDRLPLTPREPRTPQDIAAALDEEQGGGSGGKVELPLPAGYGEPPRPGESVEDWRKRQSQLETQHGLAEAEATLAKLEADNTTTEEALVAAKNDVLQARNRVTAAELAGAQQERDAAGVQVAALPGMGAAPRPGQTAESYSKEQAALEASHKRMQAEAELAQVQADSSATQEDLTKAQNSLTDARQSEWQAVLRLNESTVSASDALGEIGAHLDKDFGLSKGLPGLADNIVRFVANLATAPLQGQLAAISEAQGGIDKTGSGLLGMAAAQGAFGPRYTQAGIAAAEGYTNGGYQMPGAYSGPATVGGGNVNAMLALAQQASGRTDYAPASDLINGLADCSGSISDLYEVLTTGASNAGRQFTTTNFASDAEAAKLGFLPGFQPGALNVGVNPYPGMSGHMAATLPNGVNFEGGGGTGGGAQYGGSAAGALDPQFEKQYHFPLGGAASVSSPVPVTVVNAPAGGLPASAPVDPSRTPTAPNGLYAPENTNPGLTNPAAPAQAPPKAGPVFGPPMPAGPPMNVPLLGFNTGGPVPMANPNKGYQEDKFRAPFGPGWGLPVESRPTHTGRWMNPTLPDMGGGNWHVGPSLGGQSAAGITIWDILKQNDPARRGAPQGKGAPQGNNIGPTDTVPAMLTPGEFVVNAGAAAKFGPLLHEINGFQGGGEVPPPHLPPPPPPPPSAPVGANIMQHLSPGTAPGAAPAAPGQGTGPAPGPSPVGGGEPVATPGGGANVGGGLAGLATSAASMAADAFAPGSGAAVQMASQQIQRAIKFGAQATGILAGGLMDTFLPFGGSDLANNNWITRVGGAFAGVAPQIPNLAGKSASADAMMAKQQAPTMMTMPAPPPVSSGQGAGPAPGPAPGSPPVINNTNVFNVDPSVTALENLGQQQTNMYQNMPGQR